MTPTGVNRTETEAVTEKEQEAALIFEVIENASIFTLGRGEVDRAYYTMFPAESIVSVELLAKPTPIHRPDSPSLLPFAKVISAAVSHELLYSGQTAFTYPGLLAIAPGDHSMTSKTVSVKNCLGCLHRVRGFFVMSTTSWMTSADISRTLGLFPSCDEVRR